MLQFGIQAEDIRKPMADVGTCMALAASLSAVSGMRICNMAMGWSFGKVELVTKAVCLDIKASSSLAGQFRFGQKSGHGLGEA